MTAKRPPTNGDIFSLVNDQRLENKEDLKELSNKIDALAAKVDTIDKAQAVSSTKLGMLVAAISLVVSAIVSGILAQVKGRII